MRSFGIVLCVFLRAGIAVVGCVVMGGVYGGKQGSNRRGVFIDVEPTHYEEESV